MKILKCSWCGSDSDKLISCGNGSVICTYCHKVTTIKSMVWVGGIYTPITMIKGYIGGK